MHPTLSFLLLLLSFHISLLHSAELLPYNPVANPSAVVSFGQARFTVLTDSIIRIEYRSSNGKFEDRATPAFVNRYLPVPPFTQDINGSFLTIKTAALQLKYQIGAPFSASSLSIVGLNPDSGFTSWTYGDSNPGNLLGTIKSLDLLSVTSLNCDTIKNVMVNDESLHCEWGLVSRNGWVVVNDSDTWGLDSTFWWDSPNTDIFDLYFFGHGLNYKQALADYILIGGKIAMVPRYIYGISWSRWYNLNNADVVSIVNEYQNRYLPLDVFIIDMDWHIKNGWGAYSWDRRLFPYPENILSYLQSKGLAVSANLHDADGVQNFEDQYKPFCNAIGVNPNAGQNIPFSSVNATYLRAVDDYVLAPLLDQGMNFWWIDWQQGGTTGGCTGQKQNPTYILDHLRSTYHLRHGENVRGLVLARWGGLGTHRYQVGFSGDVAGLSWANLAYQPYFSWTASNVGYGFWSHDIVGPYNNHELHTRWIQWGAYSGIFRTHDRGMSSGSCADNGGGDCPIVEVWAVPDPYFSANRDAMNERASLIPYIYNAARQAYDTGLSLLRPMYYEFPKLEYAYKGDAAGNFGQYFFGNDMFVAPVTKPALTNTSLAPATIWIPPGNWYEKTTGALITGAADGNTLLTKSYDISEIPVFIKAGAIIPKIPVPAGNTLGLARRQYTTLVLEVYPGMTSGSINLYEDDGVSVDYLSNKNTWTQISYTRTPTNFQLVISPSSGNFLGFPSTRNYIIRIVNGLPLISGSVNGNALSYSRFDVPNTWKYEGETLTTIITTAFLSTTASVTVNVNTATINANLSGFKGAVQKAVLAKRNLDPDWGTPGSQAVTGGYLSRLASLGFELSYLAGTDTTSFYLSLNTWNAAYTNATTEIENIKPKFGDDPPNALVQYWDSERNDSLLCGTPQCISENDKLYTRMRVEGLQPGANEPNTVKLNDYWSAIYKDNFATTSPNMPSSGSYSPASFNNGIVYSTTNPPKNTVPLSVYWNQVRLDFLTVATTEGKNWAQQYNYSIFNATIGYVHPPSSYGRDLAIPLSRWSYSIELLYNALN